MSNDLDASVSTPEEAATLREEFEEVIARVNGDLFGQTIDCCDTLSVERAVMQAEQAIDYHLKAFGENTTLQQLAPLIKSRFADGIRDQAKAGVQKQKR